MYFQNFPLTLYSQFDDLSNVTLVTNITVRVKLNDEVKNNLSLFDEYDIKDGETPEIIADKFYSNPQLHWLVLHVNDIIDPRFDWCLSTHDLRKFVQGKYSNVNGIHHYEDANGNYVNANVFLNSTNEFHDFINNTAISNATQPGSAVVLNKLSNSNVYVRVTNGGFNAGDSVIVSGNLLANANVTAAITLSGIPVTNSNYEDTINETKRRIKILKSQYVGAVIRDFKKKLEL